MNLSDEEVRKIASLEVGEELEDNGVTTTYVRNLFHNLLDPSRGYTRVLNISPKKTQKHA